METHLADWGIELAFFRATVGREFDFIKRTTAKTPEPPVFFGTYGYFDLAAIRCLRGLATPSFVPLDNDVLESAPFRFFADSANGTTESFLSGLKSWKTGIAVFLKINPIYFQKGPGDIRIRTGQVLRKDFKDAHIFFGLGYSEILVLAGGDDLPALLASVTRLRKPSEESSVADAGATEPLFVQTTTFPLVSYDQIHASKRYYLLRGQVHPIITVSCDPRVEQRILAELPDGMFCRNSYGESDLVLYWDKPTGIDFAEFAQFLTDLRLKFQVDALVVKTTTYLETGREKPGGVPESNALAVPKDLLADGKVFDAISQIEPEALRASASDLVLRLSACLRDRTLEPDYRDMAQTFEFLKSVAQAIATGSHLAQLKARSFLTEICDLARTAINQRYAGLETHPETLAHSQSPLLCDIRSIVLASSSLPAFVFDRLKADPARQSMWAGYVLFGVAYTAKLYPQNILALPATAIYRPVEEWIRITHEVAHAVYDVLHPWTHASPALRSFLVDACDWADHASNVFNEFFAAWFDWKYIFKRDTRFFIQSVWKAWLKVPIVWESKYQYLIRSFAIVIADSLDEVNTAWDAGRFQDHLLPKLQKLWAQFYDIVRDVEQMDQYLADWSEEEQLRLFKRLDAIISLLTFFEKDFERACGVEGLSERMAPGYDRVDAHTKSLLQGQIILEPIPNPCELHIHLMKALNGAPTLKSEIAYILSLENHYVTTVLPLNAL